MFGQMPRPKSLIVDSVVKGFPQVVSGSSARMSKRFRSLTEEVISLRCNAGYYLTMDWQLQLSCNPEGRPVLVLEHASRVRYVASLKGPKLLLLYREAKMLNKGNHFLMRQFN